MHKKESEGACVREGAHKKVQARESACARVHAKAHWREVMRKREGTCVREHVKAYERGCEGGHAHERERAHM